MSETGGGRNNHCQSSTTQQSPPPQSPQSHPHHSTSTTLGKRIDSECIDTATTIAAAAAIKDIVLVDAQPQQQQQRPESVLLTAASASSASPFPSSTSLSTTIIVDDTAPTSASNQATFLPSCSTILTAVAQGGHCGADEEVILTTELSTSSTPVETTIHSNLPQLVVGAGHEDVGDGDDDDVPQSSIFGADEDFDYHDYLPTGSGGGESSQSSFELIDSIGGCEPEEVAQLELEPTLPRSLRSENVDGEEAVEGNHPSSSSVFIDDPLFEPYREDSRAQSNQILYQPRAHSHHTHPHHHHSSMLVNVGDDGDMNGSGGVGGGGGGSGGGSVTGQAATPHETAAVGGRDVASSSPVENIKQQQQQQSSSNIDEYSYTPTSMTQVCLLVVKLDLGLSSLVLLNADE